MIHSQGGIGDDKQLAEKIAAAGGICQQKFEGASDREEFTLEHCQQLQDAFEHLLEYSEPAVTRQLLDQIEAVLEAILRDPELAEPRHVVLPPEVGVARTPPERTNFDTPAVASSGRRLAFCRGVRVLAPRRVLCSLGLSSTSEHLVLVFAARICSYASRQYLSCVLSWTKWHTFRQLWPKSK